MLILFRSLLLDDMLGHIYYLSAWLILYIIIQKFNSRCTSEWNSRIVACIHACVVCRVTEYHQFKWPWHWEEFGKPNLHHQSGILFFSGSYFMFSLLNGIYMRKESSVMLFHHFAGALCMFSCYYVNRSGYEFVLALWASEFTNPLLHIRWFLRMTDRHATMLAIINELIFVMVFFFCRVIFISYIVYQIFFVAANVHYSIKCSTFLVEMTNLVFFKQIIMFVRKRFLKGTIRNVDADM